MKTIQAVSAPRLNQVPSQKRAPLPAQEAKEKREESQATQAAIDAEVADFMTYATTKATALGKRFDKSTRYFLDMFFQGGAHLVNHQNKLNAFNAFKAEKAAERREEGAPGLKAQGLHDLYKDEYDALTEEEKTALLDRFAETKDKVPKARRDTPRARIRDVSNTVRNIQMLMHGLSYRVGIEGLFCIVRNNPDFHMIPQWYFTSPELERYMPLAVRRKWDTAEVGCRLEAFAIAGCDTMNLLRSNKQKVDFLKSEIRDGVHSGLVTITGRPTIRMDYIYYKESIVLKYGIELIGWPLEHFVNPSDLSSSLPILTQVRDALKNGTCKWVKLSPADRKARKAAWDADVAAGKVVERARAPCCDTGQKRKAAAIEDDTTDEELGDGNPPPANVDGPIVEEPEDDASDPSPSAPPPAKRRKTQGEAPKKAAPKAKTSARKGTASGGVGARDDAVTRGAIEKAQARRVKSRAVVVDSDDDDENTAPTPAPAAADSVFTAEAHAIPIDPVLLLAA
ncbi:hypothetical protein B0H14DRAFT_3598809 [Mycena olivaceomarginata]|nr:hypothetical protein B0H14DRAFT_3598809 [Mycena olivaceomarginata]